MEINLEIGAFQVGSDASQKQKSILKRISPFFSKNIIEDVLIPLVNQDSGISLRALDWLVIP